MLSILFSQDILQACVSFNVIDSRMVGMWSFIVYFSVYGIEWTIPLVIAQHSRVYENGFRGQRGKTG